MSSAHTSRDVTQIQSRASLPTDRRDGHAHHTLREKTRDGQVVAEILDDYRHASQNAKRQLLASLAQLSGQPYVTCPAGVALLRDPECFHQGADVLAKVMANQPA
ncbi:hypothetical protein ACFW5W_33220 [Streptomyces sp. NPDC058783]|uniref:hypothetical protein n=1 Tax=Streptomyces sp. NPDC058783 TaxID=3346633 RepID=UPI00368AC9E0